MQFCGFDVVTQKALIILNSRTHNAAKFYVKISGRSGASSPIAITYRPLRI